MKIRAIGDNILVKRLDWSLGESSIFDPNTIVKSTIKIPDSWLAKPIVGRVVDVGRGTISALGHLHPHTVQIGDVVLFDHRAGSEITINNEKLLIIKEDAILGTL